ncbi:O-antigen ligase family protein [Desulfosarcina alkanivorans]|uniref:O-antigen ligase family protein n=1 Tax=Desulfosarcina alkanivorans TaxID=571177 RepID=UPI00142E9FDC|nr:O-antigen ligase family protein [Desulfosarcina alkanivorans]
MSIPTAVHVRVSFNFIFPGYLITFIFFILFYKFTNNLEHLIKVIFVTCAGCGIYSLMASLAGGGADRRLFFSTTFDPNDLAYFTLVFLPLNLFFITRSNGIFIRLSALIFIVAGLVLIFLTQSRGGFVALVVSLIILFFWSKKISKSIKIALLVIGAFIISVAPVNFERFSTLMSIEDDYNLTSPTGRIEIWKTGLRMMIDNPLTGVGVGNFARAIGYERQEIGSGPARWQSPHNSLIEVGTEAGFIALGLYLYLSFNALRIFVRGRNQTREPVLSRICEFLVIGFVGMFTAAMFLSQAFSIYWVFYIALSAAINQMLQRQSKEKVTQRVLSS